MRKSSLFLFLLLLAFVRNSPLKAAEIFRGLGDLPGGPFEATVEGMSPDGRYIVGMANAPGPGNREAYRWSEDSGMVYLGIPPGNQYSLATAVSADGSVVAGYGAFGSGFRWTAETGRVLLSQVEGEDIYPTSVSWDGTKICGSYYPAVHGGSSAAFRWTFEGGVQDIGGFSSRSHGMSADGSVLGYSKNFDAGRWMETTGLVSIGDLPGGSYHSMEYGVSADGNTVVGYSMSGASPSNLWEAFLWRNGEGMIGLGDLPGGPIQSQAFSVSGNGMVVGGDSFVAQGSSALSKAAFIWDQAHGMRDVRQMLTDEYGIDMTGWWLGRVTAISYDGTIFGGHGINPEGDEEGWIVTIPEPSTLLLCAAAVPLLLVKKNRRAQ